MATQGGIQAARLRSGTSRTAPDQGLSEYLYEDEEAVRRRAKRGELKNTSGESGFEASAGRMFFVD